MIFVCKVWATEGLNVVKRKRILEDVDYMREIRPAPLGEMLFERLSNGDFPIETTGL